MGMAGGDSIDGHGVWVNPGCADGIHGRAGVRPGARQSCGGLACRSTPNPEHSALQGADSSEHCGTHSEIFKHV